MDNSNWWIEFIHLKKYTNKHTQMFKTGIICLRENKPLREKDQSLPIKTSRRISKEKILLFIYILMRLTRRDLGNVVLIIYIRLSYSFTSVWLLKKKYVHWKKVQLNNCVTYYKKKIFEMNFVLGYIKLFNKVVYIYHIGIIIQKGTNLYDVIFLIIDKTLVVHGKWTFIRNRLCR